MPKERKAGARRADGKHCQDHAPPEGEVRGGPGANAESTEALEMIEGEMGAFLKAVSGRADAAGSLARMTEEEERAGMFLLDAYAIERQYVAQLDAKQQRTQDLRRAEELLDVVTRARDGIERRLWGWRRRQDPEWRQLARRARGRCSELATALEEAVNRLKRPPHPGPDPGWEALVAKIQGLGIRAEAACGDLLRREERMSAPRRKRGRPRVSEDNPTLGRIVAAWKSKEHHTLLECVLACGIADAEADTWVRTLRFALDRDRKRRN